MKVQADTLGVRFNSITAGSTFTFNGEVYLKTTLTGENLYYAVALGSGICTLFFDDTLVYPIKLMAVPEE